MDNPYIFIISYSAVYFEVLYKRIIYFLEFFVNSDSKYGAFSDQTPFFTFFYAKITFFDTFALSIVFAFFRSSAAFYPRYDDTAQGLTEIELCE